MKKLSELNTKNYKILFSDLDGTLIKTKSGKTFPEDASDYEFKKEVVDAIKKLSPTYLFIVTNQGGIGKFVHKSDFENKLSDIVSYLEINTGCYAVDAIYCDSDDKKNDMRKPNTGMLSKMLDSHSYSHSLISLYNKNDMLMIGDASGLPGQFSDSDKKCAENFGIDYLDVSDFVKTYNK